MPGATLEREVALTVSHLDRARDLHREMMGRLLQMEVYIDTELSMVEGSTVGYEGYGTNLHFRQKPRCPGHARPLQPVRIPVSEITATFPSLAWILFVKEKWTSRIEDRATPNENNL